MNTYTHTNSYVESEEYEDIHDHSVITKQSEQNSIRDDV